jgi:hypothetical protein
MEEKFDKRHKLITGVKRILDDLHIYYYRPAQPMVECMLAGTCRHPTRT